MKSGEMNHRINFEKLNTDTEEWGNHYQCWSKVNIAGGNEYFAGRTEHSNGSVIFEVRYCDKLKDLYLKTQKYRIRFGGVVYDIQDVDNYMFKNTTLKIKAVGRGDR